MDCIALVSAIEEDVIIHVHPHTITHYFTIPDNKKPNSKSNSLVELVSGKALYVKDSRADIYVQILNLKK